MCAETRYLASIFSVRLGQKAVLRIAVGLLLCNYLAAASLLAYAALVGLVERRLAPRRPSW